MNAVQLHLALNHLPIVGLIAFGIVLIYAMWRGGREARRIALVGLAVSGLLTIPVLLSGESAEETVEHLGTALEPLIHNHEEAADVASTLSIITGIAALLVLGLELWMPRFRRMASAGLVVLVLVSAVAVGWTGHLGGLIRHPELRQGGAAAALTPGTLGGAQGGDHDDDDDDRGR